MIKPYFRRHAQYLSPVAACHAAYRKKQEVIYKREQSAFVPIASTHLKLKINKCAAVILRQ